MTYGTKPFRWQAKKELQSIFDSLSQDEQDALLDVKRASNNSKSKSKPLMQTSSNDALPTHDSSPLKAQDTAADNADGENDSTQRPVGRVKKSLDPEKAAKVRASVGSSWLVSYDSCNDCRRRNG